MSSRPAPKLSPPNPIGAQQSDAMPPPVVVPCQKCWIAIQLLDENDQPVPREPYWIRLPNGQIREGSLNDEGSVRLDPVPCGTCLVRFPKADGPALRRVSTHVNTGWITIKLLDEAGQPVAGQPYSVTLPDGKKVDGKLDRQGQARHDGIPEGKCQVSFPGLAPEEFLARRGER